MKKLLLATSVAALVFFAGCSKQPQLENVEENTTAKTTQETNVSKPKEIIVQDTTMGSEENVSTENAKVEEETITPPPSSSTITISNVQNNQDFAKKLSSIVIYFDFDKYYIRKDQWPKVEKLAELIKSNPSNYTVRIEGNCDEWGTEEYNYALGLKRANSVKNALIKLGVDPKKLTVISYGELNPVCTAHARWCWRLNRRDNFTYLP